MGTGENMDRKGIHNGEKIRYSPKYEKKSDSIGKKAARFLGKLLLLLLETALLLVCVLYGVMYVVAKGPSPTARDLFVMSVKETSAIGFLADLYLSPEEIAEITTFQMEEDIQTDKSLIHVPAADKKNETDTPVVDEWGLCDEDGDGIIVEPVNGEGYSGFMMVVLDPTRVIMGSVPESYGGKGYTVAEMVAHFDAVAGINAGGFYDPNGMGNGSIPDSMVVFEGKRYYSGCRQGFVGLDSDSIMHVSTNMTDSDIQEQNIQYGVSFGPVLISNGEIVLPEGTVSGLNPRTAIGQRSDGAILMLVIDGRQVVSLGATLWDLAEVFQKFGAVNACNLDGGSSTLMWYQGDYINNCASVVGIRPVPTTFLVLKEGAGSND